LIGMSTLISPIAAMLVNVAAQVILFRLRHGGRFFRSIIEGVLFGGIALVACEAFLVASSNAIADRLFLAVAVNLPIFLCLSYCYYTFVQMGQASIRVRLYTEIALRPGGVVISEIEREYDETALTELRLRRLIESGDVVAKSGCYFIGQGRLLLIANIIFAAKYFLLRKKSEFE
jgi:hypothetical protein